MNILQNWWQTLVSVFFTQSCTVCGSEVESGVFCHRCRSANLLLEPMLGLKHLDGAAMGYKYDGALKDMLHKLKFEGERKFLQPLEEEAAFMARAYGGRKFDMVVSIPTDAQRRKQRGYDIPEAVFKNALAQHGAWQPDVLARVKPTTPQYGLTPGERRSNVRGCFKAAGDVCGKNILLVDDILTTGATLEEAAKTLNNAGAKSVYALTLCGSLENFGE